MRQLELMKVEGSLLPTRIFRSMPTRSAVQSNHLCTFKFGADSKNQWRLSGVHTGEDRASGGVHSEPNELGLPLIW